MGASTQGLADRLRPYPKLQQTLGARWIQEQDSINPIDSPFPLARWLRRAGFEPDLTTLEAVLTDLASVPGIARRRERLRADAPALWETLTELYFGAWLQSRGYRFDWPASGADFAIHVGDDLTLHLEATTPRKAAWSDDLFERLDLLGLATGHAAELLFRQELLPDAALSERIVAAIVQDARVRLHAPHSADPIVQDYPDLKLRITWTVDDSVGIRAHWSPDQPPSEHLVFNYIVKAANKKRRQLHAGEIGGVVIGTRQLPDGAMVAFEYAMRGGRSEAFAWTQLPPEVRHIVIYTPVLKQVAPFGGLWFVNPMSPVQDPPEISAFFADLFPQPLRGRDKPAT